VQAALIATGPQGERPLPQLYSAPDPTEDFEAQRSMENLALLAVQAHNVISSGNALLNATQIVLNQTRDFFMHGVLPMAGLDPLDLFLLKKIGMLSHCGFENDMKITYNNITDELMCAMRVHLMNESEIHVFCPKDALVWEENCMNVEFMNFTAISFTNEIAVVNALRSSIYNLLGSYPTTIETDIDIINNYEKTKVDDNNEDNNNIIFGPITYAAMRLRYREKQILHSALNFLYDHEQAVFNGTIIFQLALKAQERIEADLREIEHKKFLQNVREKASFREDLAFIEVDLGDNKPKANLTLQEGRDFKETIQAFCNKYFIKPEYFDTLSKALKNRVKNPPPLKLLLGVIIPATGDRKLLGIQDLPNVNATVETSVFCSQNDPKKDDPLETNWCQGLLKRVEERLNVTKTFTRKTLLVVPIDAPDSRKLQLVLREGEQHDLFQFVSDFLEYYHMPQESLTMLTNEVHKRLPAIALQIPIAISSKRQVSIRFSISDNITNVVNAFSNFYEIDDSMKVAIFQRARYGMAPGTFMV
jgi:hypothetical protein